MRCQSLGADAVATQSVERRRWKIDDGESSSLVVFQSNKKVMAMAFSHGNQLQVRPATAVAVAARAPVGSWPQETLLCVLGVVALAILVKVCRRQRPAVAVVNAGDQKESRFTADEAKEMGAMAVACASARKGARKAGVVFTGLDEVRFVDYSEERLEKSEVVRAIARAAPRAFYDRDRDFAAAGGCYMRAYNLTDEERQENQAEVDAYMASFQRWLERRAERRAEAAAAAAAAAAPVVAPAAAEPRPEPVVGPAPEQFFPQGDEEEEEVVVAPGVGDGEAEGEQLDEQQPVPAPAPRRRSARLEAKERQLQAEAEEQRRKAEAEEAAAGERRRKAEAQKVAKEARRRRAQASPLRRSNRIAAKPRVNYKV